MLTKVLAIETAKYGIHVNSVHPGYVETEMLRGALDDPDVRIRNSRQLCRLGGLVARPKWRRRMRFLLG